MRLINADRFLAQIEDQYMEHDITRAQYLDLEDRILQQPTVDAVPVVHGRWIIKDNPGTGWYRVTCSECGEDVTSVAPVIGFFPKAKVTWDFCPNCGAKMDGKDGEQL